jgi:WD40 repeat protein/tRNA A-37 threonylcarbamoyl transferase component Bud32
MCSEILDGNNADGAGETGLQTGSATAPVAGCRIHYFGDYELLSEIARGGMGVVYKARQMRLNRVVALKMILDGALDNDTAVRRFHAEAQAAASLQHPAIVAIHEVGEHEGRHYFSMDYIDGQSLARVIGGKPLPRKKAAECLVTIAEAVHYAHTRGVLHRDLKPSNILIDANGQPHISDFGLAKQVNSESGLTLSGIVMGSPGYMPPEQLRGQNDRVDARSDVYALGATLYEMLTGRVPFLAATAIETLRQVEEKEPVSPRLLNPDVPIDLETICLKCLEKNPQKRYASAQELAADMRRFLNREPIVARPVGPWEKAVKWAGRRPAVAALIGVSVLAVSGFIIGGVWYNAQLRAEAGRARHAEVEARKQQAEAEASRKAADHNLAYTQLAQAGMYVDAGRITEAQSLYKSCLDNLRKLGESDFPVTLGLTDLYALSPPALLTLRGHTNGVFDVAFSPDGEYALSGGYDSDVKLWEIKTGRELRTFKGHQGTVYSVTFSPDGKWALSGSRDETAKMWEIGTGKEVRTFAGHPSAVRAVAFSSDGQWAITTSGLSNSVWRVDDGHLIRRFGWEETNSVIVGTAVSADGKYLLSAANQDQDITDNAVILWDLATGRDLRHFKGHLAFTAAFSPDGQRAASGSIDKTISLWDLATGKELRTLVGHRNPVEKVAFSPDGTRLLSSGWERNVRLWDVATGQEIRTFSGHGDKVYGVSCSPDGRWALSGSVDTTLKLWAIDPPEEIRAFVGHTAGITSLRFSPDGRLALSASMDYTVRVWDVATGLELRRFDLGDHAFGFSLSADGTLALATRYSDTRLIRMETGEELRRISGRLYQGEISPDGTRILSGCYLNKGPLALWDASTGKLIRKLTADAVPTIGGIVFLPDGKRAITSDDESEVTLWDLETGKKIRDFVGLNNRASCAAVSRNGAYVLSGGWDQTIRLWEIASGRCVRTFKGHEGHIYSVAFSPDGRWVLSGSADGTARIWDVQSGEEIHTLSWRTERLNMVAFAPDGLSALVGSSADGTIRLWDFKRPEQYRKYEGLVEEAQRRLTTDGGDAGALKILGEYYAFRGINDWAAELLERVRKGGVQVSPLMLARCYWALSADKTIGALDKNRYRGAAAAEFQKELDRVESLPAPNGPEDRLNREQEKLYLHLCLQAVK